MTSKIPLGQFPWRNEDPYPASRRVIIDNDFAGDPDDLFALVHHLLSPGVEIRGIVASHLGDHPPFRGQSGSPRAAAQVVERVSDTMGIDLGSALWRGSDTGLSQGRDAISPAAERIIAEALDPEAKGPLYYVAGGGLTDIAIAWLREPSIASRLTLIWIGGGEGPFGPPAPRGIDEPEYNLAIDKTAAEVVFNKSDLDTWIVPRDVYRQCLVSVSELRARLGDLGELGRYLCGEIEAVRRNVVDSGAPAPETYALGDSPLVLLTALQSCFQPDGSSSDYRIEHVKLNDRGEFVPSSSSAAMRRYTRVDTRLMFEDFFHKVREFSVWKARTSSDPRADSSTTQNEE